MRTPLVVPFLRMVVSVWLVLSLMVLVERVYMSVLAVAIRLLRRWSPKRGYKAGASSQEYPMVLVQIPMYREREVYRLSIRAVCGLSWPSDRIIVQVLDDSADPALQKLVKAECQIWEEKGVNIKYEMREKRDGYKAGALQEGLKHLYANNCDYLAIFDADFQPDPDFLHRSVPLLVHNPQIALVQGRWKFVNANDCLMTRMQEISLDYHFTVEQAVGSFTYSFFGFNGTAGVWRIAALKEVGGWKDRSTVEDMDLSVRATLKGWKFVYLNDLQVKNELPSTIKAFRNQQHRWFCGSAYLFKKVVMEIISNKKVSIWKKLYLIYSFFLVRKIVAHIVTFLFYCVIIPAAIFVPQVEVPTWGAIYVPFVTTIFHAFGTAASFRSVHLLPFWALFQNVMALHRTKATFTGLLESRRVNEWVVTEKLGDTLQRKGPIGAPKKQRFEFGERCNLSELAVGTFLFFCAFYDLACGNRLFFVYLFMQAFAFLVVGFGYVGTS